MKKVRKCLKCNRPFKSKGNHNRVCNKCKYDKSYIKYSVEPRNLNDMYVKRGYKSPSE
jgi:tRNA(Ile2) C34 agmatinyltransferase TiaS